MGSAIKGVLGLVHETGCSVDALPAIVAEFCNIDLPSNIWSMLIAHHGTAAKSKFVRSLFSSVGVAATPATLSVVFDTGSSVSHSGGVFHIVLVSDMNSLPGSSRPWPTVSMPLFPMFQ